MNSPIIALALALGPILGFWAASWLDLSILDTTISKMPRGHIEVLISMCTDELKRRDGDE